MSLIKMMRESNAELATVIGRNKDGSVCDIQIAASGETAVALAAYAETLQADLGESAGVTVDKRPGRSEIGFAFLRMGR